MEGLYLDSNTGCFFGTPSAIGLAQISIVVTDANGKSTTAGPYRIEVNTGDLNHPIGIVSTSFVPQTVGQNYRGGALVAIGGKEPYTWSHGDLPPGLDVRKDDRSNTFYLVGKPTAAGSSTVSFTATDNTGATSTATNVTIPINAAPDCGNPKYSDASFFNGWFPLATKLTKNLDANGNKYAAYPTSNDVVCFYNASGTVAPLGQVQYLYGIGQGTNTISADLVSIQFPWPVAPQVALGSSVTGGGNASTSSGQATAASTLATIQAGGNFYIYALYPFAVFNSNPFQILLSGNAKMGFNFNGFAGQSTLSQGTETYISVPAEVYSEFRAIGNAGGIYFDSLGGYQHVPDSFKTAAGLSKNDFLLGQMSFGLSFSGLLRVGAQRYFGPAAAFGATTGADFKNWHLVIQLNPTKGS